jgi:predicted RNase H-like HicB family nuclease
MNARCYSIVIEWSDEHQAHIVSLPELPDNHTHGDCYEEATKQGHDLTDSLVMWSQQDGKPLPPPSMFVGR